MRSITGRLCFLSILGFLFLFAQETRSAVAPVGHLPSVAVSLNPSIYALPILMVEDGGEWKDFGIQIRIKVHENGRHQIGKLAENEWEVAVMDPFSAIQGGNEGKWRWSGWPVILPARSTLFLPEENGPRRSRV